MGIPYKKNYVKSDGRKLLRGGPRDMQARLNSPAGLADAEIIELLKGQIDDLRYELRNKQSQGSTPPEGYFTPEQVDAEIRKAVEQAVSEAAISFRGGKQQSNDGLVKEYKSQIVELQKGNDNLARLHSAITKENTELKDKIKKLETNNLEASELKSQIALLEQKLVDKNEMIDLLKSRPAILNTTGEPTDPDRPKMEQVFVDPLEKDSGEGLKSSIKIDELKSDGGVDDKVKKLKDLLGNKLSDK